MVNKTKPNIKVYPYSYSEANGLRARKIEEVEFEGWAKFEQIPNLVRKGKKISLTTIPNKFVTNFLVRQFPEVKKIKFTKNGANRFAKKTITLNWSDFSDMVKAANREHRSYEVRRKTSINNNLSEITNKVTARKTNLPKGAVERFFEVYDPSYNFSKADIDALLAAIGSSPASTISVTSNFIQVKDRINSAYLDEVIKKYENLIKVKSDNEKEWQTFFETHGWILSNLFSYQVILYDREAYVGGKTLENKEGRVVDFLYQSGFKDNFALLEIKHHRTKLIKKTPYRKPDAFAADESLSGAISQCLDQKNIFLRDFGQKYQLLDPRVVLIVGQKSELDENQARSFELLRNNQKNVEIITFDELLEKIKGLKSILIHD